MSILIDDFTTGPPAPTPLVLNDAEVRRGTQTGVMLGGVRRTVIRLDARLAHGQPAIVDFGKAKQSDTGQAPGLNLTVPVEAPATINFIYGEAGGVLEDWSRANAMVVDVGSYKSIQPASFAIVLFSDDGRRSQWNQELRARSQPLVLPFADLKAVTPEGGVNLQRVREINFVFVFNGSVRIKSFHVD